MTAPAGILDVDIARLGRPGFFIKHGWMGGPPSETLHQKASRALAEGLLRPAGLRVTSGEAARPSAPKIRGDATLWPPDDAEWACARAPFEALREALNRQAFLGLTRFELQLAHYPGDGAGYARHRDAFPGMSNRRVTAIMYLNPDWAPGHGGELRLFTEDGTVDVAPRLDTLAVFLSERLDHEVLPSFAPRFALTAWYYAT